MNQASCVVAFACSAAAGLLLAGALHAPAHAQSADLVLCDRVAADPTDPDKPADVKGAQAIAAGDIATAIKFCRAAAAEKAPVAARRALYELGRAYEAGRQWPEAAASYRKSADKGSTSAMVELGVMLTNGTGVAKDEAQARALFQRAAQAGNPRGATNLAAVGNDAGAPSDPVEARSLLEKAAATNSAEAEFQLGMMLADGTGGPKDDARARAMFASAAAQGHPAATEWLASFEEAGLGGPKDKDAAKADYQKAVALGDDHAKAGLERLKCPLVLSTKSGEVWTHLCF
jgi:TPR repeat protein